MREGNRAGFFTQVMTRLGKRMRLFVEEREWKLIVFAVIISWLICYVIGEDMFTTYESTKSGFFTIVSAAIWIGIFNSIQSVCKEHDTIRTEVRSDNRVSAYTIGNVIFDLIICTVQAGIFTAMCYYFIDFPEAGIVFDNAKIEYFISLLLIIWSSDVMGIMISSLVSNPTVAMTVMPFVLILQLIMSGVLFELTGNVEKVANITVGKWGMSAMGSIGNLNNPELPLSWSLIFPQVVRYTTEPDYEFIADNLYKAWENMGIIVLVCIVVSIIALKIRDR